MRELKKSTSVVRLSETHDARIQYIEKNFMNLTKRDDNYRSGGVPQS